VPDLPVEPASAPLTPDHFGIPLKATFGPEELAEYVGVSVRTIYREIADGQLRAMMIRGSLRIPMVEVRHYFVRQGMKQLGILGEILDEVVER
jgi:excisionase family DNA binding protein